MLFIFETHRLHGAEYYDFETAYRDEWMPAIASGEELRLLWYFNHAHGTSRSFNVVTVTGARDWPSWQRHAEAVRSGGLQALARKLDTMRYGVSAELVRPLNWSPLQELSLGGVDSEPGGERELRMYIEDRVRPDAVDLDEGVAAIEGAYPKAGGWAELSGAFRPVVGGGSRREVILLQQVLDWDRLADHYATGEHDGGPPWSARHGSVPFSDEWSTRILRSASWSPLS